MTITDIDREAQFLQPIPAKFHHSILELAQVQSFPPGAVLLSEGSAHSDFHLLTDGHVRLEKMIPNRGRVPSVTVLLQPRRLVASG